MKYKKRAIAAGLAAAALTSGAFAAGASAAEVGNGRREHHRDLTDEQRDVIAEIRALRKAGDFEGAAALAESAGLPARPRAEGHRRFRGVDPDERDAARAAVDANDYGAFEDAVRGSRMAERAGDNLDEVFGLMVEGKDLRDAGDREGAREKMEEIRDLLGRDGDR